MKDEFVSVTFIKSCTGFKSSIPTGLPDYHPTTCEKNVKGCVGIYRDESGGFDILGEDGQHFWVAPANVIWGRKAVNPQTGLAYQKSIPEVSTPPEPVKIPESDSLLKNLMGRAEQTPVKPVSKKPVSLPRGRPRKS